MSAPAKPPKLDFPFGTDEEIADLMQQFENCTWPYMRWTHRCHLAAAAWYLTRHPLAEATDLIRRNIQNYNKTLGDGMGYHETITVLFMRGIDRALQQDRGSMSLAAFVDYLFFRFDMSWPLKYYSKERLWSAEAKAGWVEPDLKHLD